MKKKRVIIAGIAVVLVAVIAVIGMRLLGGGGSHTGIDNNPEAEVSGDSKVLVAYFSWSGNGQRALRNKIQEENHE